MLFSHAFDATDAAGENYEWIDVLCMRAYDCMVCGNTLRMNKKNPTECLMMEMYVCTLYTYSERARGQDRARNVRGIETTYIRTSICTSQRELILRTHSWIHHRICHFIRIQDETKNANYEKETQNNKVIVHFDISSRYADSVSYKIYLFNSIAPNCPVFESILFINTTIQQYSVVFGVHLSFVNKKKREKYKENHGELCKWYLQLFSLVFIQMESRNIIFNADQYGWFWGYVQYIALS